MRGSGEPLSTRPASASAEQLYFDGLAPKALNAARQAATCGSSAARSSPRARRLSSASRSERVAGRVARSVRNARRDHDRGGVAGLGGEDGGLDVHRRLSQHARARGRARARDQATLWIQRWFFAPVRSPSPTV